MEKLLAMSEFSQYIYMTYCAACDCTHGLKFSHFTIMFQWKLLSILNLSVLTIMIVILAATKMHLGSYYMLGTLLRDLHGLFLNPRYFIIFIL